MANIAATNLFPYRPNHSRPLPEKRRRILQDDLRFHINRLASITAPGKPAITRLSYTEEESLALDYIAKNAEELGLTTSYDQFGNLHCLQAGSDPSLKRVLFGSHIDSVKRAGRFDGVTGVISALESFKLLREAQITPLNTLEMIAFRGEESTRFDRALLGSSLLMGKLRTEDTANMKDSEGNSLKVALEQTMAKIDPKKVVPWNLCFSDLLAFLEVHVEQSSVLYRNRIPLGLVSIIASPERYIINVTGQSAHSGTAAMTERKGKDAILTACRFALEVNALARKASKHGRHPVATIGDFRSFDGGMNQTAEAVEMKLDVRSINERSRRNLVQRIITTAKLMEKKEPPIRFNFEQKGIPSPPVLTDRNLLSLFKKISRDLGFHAITTPSFAGHDAQNFALKIPTGMIFIQSEKGISHNPNESSEIQHIAQATELLFNALLQLASDK